MSDMLSNLIVQDPLTMAAKRLGEAKTDAERRGVLLLNIFAEIQKEVLALKEHGLSVTTVEFEDPAIQAAWRVYTTDDWTGEMPLMPTEDTIVSLIRGS